MGRVGKATIRISFRGPAPPPDADCCGRRQLMMRVGVFGGSTLEQASRWRFSTHQCMRAASGQSLEVVYEARN
eukprot:8073356-Lingulodinium_polyedra.AAC.1